MTGIYSAMEKKAVFLVIICCLLVQVTGIGSDFNISHYRSSYYDHLPFKEWFHALSLSWLAH